MIKKGIKIITISILIFGIMASILNISSNATDFGSTMIGELNNVETEKQTDASNSVNNIVSSVITIARIIGVTVAIVMLLAVAMKYMSAAPGEKADIKKSAVVYVVGATVLFAVTGLLTIINKFSTNIKAA